jgi:ribosomal protein L37AE/L43A
MVELLTELLVIFIACILADMVMRIYDHFTNKRPDIGCDYCEEARKTYRTKDKKFWLCKQCLEAYNREQL